MKKSKLLLVLLLLLLVTGCGKHVQLQYRGDDYMMSIDVPMENKESLYKIIRNDKENKEYNFINYNSAFAVVSKDYAIEINYLYYTYFTSVLYKQTYGSKEVGFNSYKEYLNDDKLFNKKLYTNYKELDDVDGVEYLYNNVYYRVINTDDIDNYKYFSIMVKSLNNEIKIEDIFDNTEMNKILNSIKFTKLEK